MGIVSLIQRQAQDERGAGIVTALMITLVVFALGATWTSVGLHQVEISSYDRYREQALHAAEAGVNEALSRLASDYDWKGTAGVVTLGDSTGEYEVTVSPVDPLDLDDLDRYVVAKGYAPSKAAARGAARQLEQQVRLDPADGFNYALFASPGGVVGQNNSTISGDVYSAGDLSLANSSKYFGNVTAVGSITTSNNNTVGGNLHAGTFATIDNSQTTIQGDVLAGTNISGIGSVDGDAQAGGTVTGVTVAGTTHQNNPPPDPVLLTMPTFTWDPANYSPAPPPDWTSASNFRTHWDSNKTAFSGHHRVKGGDNASNKLALDKTWTMSGDVTLAADGPITLSRDVANGTSGDVVLTIISLSAQSPAIELTNNLTMPATVKILLYAPNGSIDFSQLKDFHGVVYGEELNLSQQFTLTHAPPTVPGFSWSASSVTHFDVDVLTFREVPFTP